MSAPATSGLCTGVSLFTWLPYLRQSHLAPFCMLCASQPEVASHFAVNGRGVQPREHNGNCCRTTAPSSFWILQIKKCNASIIFRKVLDRPRSTPAIEFASVSFGFPLADLGLQQSSSPCHGSFLGLLLAATEISLRRRARRRLRKGQESQRFALGTAPA